MKKFALRFSLLVFASFVVFAIGCPTVPNMAALGPVTSLHLQVNAAGTVTGLSWTWDYTTYPGCSTTVTKNCVNGFQVAEDDGAGPVVQATTANPASPTGVMTVTQSYTPKFTGWGNYNLMAQAKYIDNNAVQQTGPWASISVQASGTPPAPGGIKTLP